MELVDWNYTNNNEASIVGAMNHLICDHLHLNIGCV